MKLLLFFITLIQGVILISGDNYTKGSALYTYPNAATVAVPYPTTFQENYNGDLKFLVFGDWGQLGKQTGQAQVAAGMTTWANANSTTFMLNLGDNFYQSNNAPKGTAFNNASDYEGVFSETDPKWKSYWLDVYGGQLANITWYSIAGNHDWYNNVTAEVDYFWDIDSRFFLPALYYTRKVTFGNGVTAAFIHIDTNPFYYNYTNYTKVNNMKSNLQTFNLYNDAGTNATLKWLDDQLTAVDDCDWIFVVGHHPLVGDCRLYDPKDYYEMYRLVPYLEKHKVSAYFNGHTHELAVSVANSTSPVTYFGSGAGGASLGSACPNPTWTVPNTFGFLSIYIPADGKTLQYQYVSANTTNAPTQVLYSGTVNAQSATMYFITSLNFYNSTSTIIFL
ncbi:23095_t:CDS:2 [Dentiscutata erythropus]|uniref:23095_t:CDS:1 n=1 Tax=Dentiscutata erythropus TaxID=1348616 RepID=A0A9N9HP16_9GLOM|nr:23095_t:CDS:2 [Dentiscutata erythropus]